MPLLLMEVPLERALEAQIRNGGEAGVDGETLESLNVCRPGRAQEVLERTARWLKAKGLKLNESKTRLVDIRQTGINFLGFNLTWRQSLKHRRYLHVEPSQKSRQALREALGGILNHWMIGRAEYWGNPSVRFDEGRERDGHWPLAFQPILSRLLYNRLRGAKRVWLRGLSAPFRQYA